MKMTLRSRLLSAASLAAASLLCATAAWAQSNFPAGVSPFGPPPQTAITPLLAGPATVNIGTPSKPSSSVVNPGGSQRANTFLEILGSASGKPQVYGPPYPGYFFETPASLACIYSLTPDVPGCNPNDTALQNVPQSKGSKYIAIVDAYSDYPEIYTELAAYEAQFGLAAGGYPNTLQVWYTGYGTTNAPGCKSGSYPQPPSAAGTGWDLEASLDVEMAHSMAPGATILLVEAQSNSVPDLACAVLSASALIKSYYSSEGEVSNSWGLGEFCTAGPGNCETDWDPIFTKPGLVYFASAGDSPGTEWPSVSPYLLSAGGTTIRRNGTTGDFIGQSTWTDAGGGPSTIEAKPAFQKSLVPGFTRGTPDIAFESNPDTGVWIYNTTYEPPYVWWIVGGTSVASPSLAAIINSAGSFLTSSQAEGTEIYTHTGAWTEITDGYCGVYAQYSAGAPWNFCTGVGVPKGFADK